MDKEEKKNQQIMATYFFISLCSELTLMFSLSYYGCICSEPVGENSWHAQEIQFMIFTVESILKNCLPQSCTRTHSVCVCVAGDICSETVQILKIQCYILTRVISTAFTNMAVVTFSKTTSELRHI